MTDEPFDLFSIFADRRFGDDVELRVERLGTIVHDGILVACDPFSGSPQAFARRFPAGAHAVEALVQREGKNEVIAFARVVFSQAVPVTFEHATRGDEDVRMLAPGQRFGYGVDAGTACFAASDDLVDDNEDLAAQFEADRRIGWRTARSHPRGEGHGLVAFTSGHGDGIYSSYVGLDATGSPVCLVTDFRCIDVLLPPTPDDPGFRRAYAKKMYARMKDHVHDLAGPGRGIAYEAAASLGGSPADAVGVVATLFGDLRATRDEMARDLYVFALQRILAAPAAQQIAAPLLGELDERTLERLLVDTRPRQADPSWFEAVRSLWSRPALRERILVMERTSEKERAAPDPITLQHAVECLDANEPRLVELALSILGDAKQSGTALDERVLVRARAIAERGPAASSERACRAAFELLQTTGDDLEPFLTTGSAASRLAAAKSIRRRDATRADRVLVELAHDPAVDLELRFSASESIRDVDARVAALLAVGLAGHHAAPIQLRYAGGPVAIAALDRLVAEGPTETVRSQAARYAQIAREIEAHRTR